MQQIVRRRLRPAPPPARSRGGALPSYLLFAPMPGFESRAAVEAATVAAPVPARRPGRRRTSVLLFLERVLWPS